MFRSSKLAMNALHQIFDLFQRSIISSPLVTELPMEVVLLSSAAILLYPTMH